MMSKHKPTTSQVVKIGETAIQLEYMAQDTVLGPALQLEHSWEDWQVAIYRKVLKSNSVCIDVGGNVGVNAIAMAHFAADGAVYSFEPIPSLYALLRKKCSTLRFDASSCAQQRSVRSGSKGDDAG